MHAQAVVVPDTLEVVVGWRAWKVALTDGAPRLRAMTRLGCRGGAWWPVGRPLEAVCATAAHRAPIFDCCCGVHAAQSYEVLDELGLVDRTGHAIAVGSVSLWGRLIQTEHGWRAQRAYPRELWLPRSIGHLAAGLAAAYQVPVRVRREREAQLL